MYTIHLEFLLIASKLKLSYQDLNLASPDKQTPEKPDIIPIPRCLLHRPDLASLGFPFIRLKALAPLELAVRLQTLRQGVFTPDNPDYVQP